MLRRWLRRVGLVGGADDDDEAWEWLDLLPKFLKKEEAK